MQSEHEPAWEVVAVFEATVVSSFCFVFFSVALEVGFEETGADVTAEALALFPSERKCPVAAGDLLLVTHGDAVNAVKYLLPGEVELIDVNECAWALLDRAGALAAHNRMQVLDMGAFG